MKIEKLKKLTNGKYKVYLSTGESFVTYDDVIIKNNLLYSKEITPELYNNIEIDNNYYSLYNKCINLISKRIRSEKEIRDYLSKYTADKNDIDKIVYTLKDIKLLNDTSFAKAFISDKINLSNMGPLKIKQELLEHNISESIINDIIYTIDEDIITDKINKYITKKIKNNTKYSSYYLKQKILGELINLGYSKNMVLEQLNNFKIVSNIDKEYTKQLEKLRKKYSGNELLYNLKNKLYQKGYSSEEINDKIKEMD